jgi:hypothetical protein
MRNDDMTYAMMILGQMIQHMVNTCAISHVRITAGMEVWIRIFPTLNKSGKTTSGRLTARQVDEQASYYRVAR